MASELEIYGNVKSETFRSARTDGDVYIQATTASDFVAIGTQVSSNLLKVEGSGNVGVGCDPESWQSTRTALQLGGNGSLNATSAAGSGGHFDAAQNAYINSSGSWSYINNGEASLHNQVAGKHSFRVAASGNADAAISWTTALEIANSGLATFSNGINLGDTTLSNYAEGTFTPEAWDNDATQITCSVAVGRYVRVGKTVNISMRLTRNDATAFASNVYFRALPFTSQNVGSSTTYTKNIGGGSCWLPSDTRHGIAYALPGTTKVIFVDAKGADGGYIISSEWANGNNLYASFTYEIA